MQLSIIIPVFYGEEIFEKCLATLYPGSESRLGKDWEILVLNNGFNPERWRELQKIYPKIKFYGDGGENLGYAKGNNFLLKKSRGDYILMMNSDVFVRPRVIEKLITFLEKNQEYSCVAPQLRYENGKLQFSCRPFPEGLWFLVVDFLTGGKKYRRFYSPEKSQEVDQPLATFLLWRGDILKKLGGFDTHPHFFLYFNDADLSYRLKRSGGKTFFLASTYAYHIHGHSTQLLKELRRLTLWYKGLGRFWYKTGSNYFVAYFKAFWGTFFWGIAKVIKKIVF
ncbi:MAG: glycosyltransferase [Candidatus Moraniibacteriota bacterium]